MMFEILSDRRYRALFLAQVAAVMGNGLATVALSLLAFELAGEGAALVVGTVLTLKMVAYVTIAPMAGALATRFPRRSVLIGLDVVRALAALALPFVNAVWQVYVLIVLLQAASAAFTPTLQATIPDVLEDEERYTKALSLTRLAYDLESFLSPVLAAAILAVASFNVLFVGTHLGFVISALLILSVSLPSPRAHRHGSFADDTFRGLRIYLATPRLRGLLALCFSVAAAGAMVLVNTVVVIRSELGLGESAVALALGAFGLGSITAALALPKMLERLPERRVMTAGAAIMVASLAGVAGWAAWVELNISVVLTAWCAAGFGTSAVLTPSGRLLRRSSQPEDRPAVFAAQFALSHLCWLVCYPLAGIAITWGGLVFCLLLLGSLAFASLVVALRLWPADDPTELEHAHPELSSDHPHLAGSEHHRHAFIIDDLHRAWPVPHAPEQRGL